MSWRGRARLPHISNEAIHALRDLPNVIDICAVDMVGTIELEPRAGQRAMEAFRKAFDLGVTVRLYGDSISMAPPLVMERKHIDELLSKLRDVLKIIP
jgi:beta-alanine--pyruvate transaminase